MKFQVPSLSPRWWSQVFPLSGSSSRLLFFGEDRTNDLCFRYTRHWWMLQYHVFEMLPFPADFQWAGIQTSIFQAADSSPENFSETLLSVELGTPQNERPKDNDFRGSPSIGLKRFILQWSSKLKHSTHFSNLFSISQFLTTSRPTKDYKISEEIL